MKRNLYVDKAWLYVPSCHPVATHRTKVRIIVGSHILHNFEIPVAADGSLEWWAAIDVRELKGQEIVVDCDSDAFLNKIHCRDSRPETKELYQERLRPLFHFSPRNRWLNDPNGLVFFHVLINPKA